MAQSKALTSFLKNATNLPVLTDEQLASAIDNAGVSANETGVTYLNFSGKSGVYQLGRDKAEPDPDALYLIEPTSLLKGWTCWKNSKPIEKFEWRALFDQDKAMAEEELPDHGPYRENLGEGWKPMIGFGIVAFDGQQTSIKFTTTSVSAANSVRDVMEAIKTRAANREPQLPIIRLEAEQFEAQSQTNWKPVFAVESWVTHAAAKSYFDGAIKLDKLLAGEPAADKQIGGRQGAPARRPEPAKKAAAGRGRR